LRIKSIHAEALRASVPWSFHSIYTNETAVFSSCLGFLRRLRFWIICPASLRERATSHKLSTVKLLIVILALGSTALAQDGSPSSEGPIFDSTGHLTAYIYSDGTRDKYAYDASWRMMRFIDRQGKVTTFVYNADGSMKTIQPDGSTR